MPVWRLIESPPADIVSQMDLDRELFEKFVQNPVDLPILRIYQVSKPGVSVGYSYQYNRAYNRVPLPKVPGSSGGASFEPGTFGRGTIRPTCIRPTGGGLVEHGSDLIYSVMARRDTFPTFHRVRTSYLSFHEAVQESLQILGIQNRLLRCDEAKRNTGLGRCFQDPVATDVLVDDQKVAGGAQRRKGDAFLHQGSVKLIQGITYEALKAPLIESFEKKFKISWQRESEAL